MRAAPLLVLALLAAGTTAAQAAEDGLKLAAEPGWLEMRPASGAYVNFSLYNPTQRPIAVTLEARAPDAGGVHVLLSSHEAKIGAGQAIRIPMRIETRADAPRGDVDIALIARQAPPVETSADASPQTWRTTLTIRVLPALARPTPDAPPASPTRGELTAPIDQPRASPTRGELAAQNVEPPRAPATKEAPPTPTRAWALAATAAAAGASLAALAWAHRRWGFLGAAPLYTRLAKSQILEQPVRERIADLVRQEPGITFGEVRRKLDLAAGMLTHHARMLEDAGVIFSSPDGEKRRFFATSHGRVAPIPPLSERLLNALRLEGPATLTALAARLGVSRQALHYHVKKLASEGRIETRPDGRETILTAA